MFSLADSNLFNRKIHFPTFLSIHKNSFNSLHWVPHLFFVSQLYEPACVFSYFKCSPSSYFKLRVFIRMTHNSSFWEILHSLLNEKNNTVCEFRIQFAMWSKPGGGYITIREPHKMPQMWEMFPWHKKNFCSGGSFIYPGFF